MLLGYGLALATLGFTARSLNSGLTQLDRVSLGTGLEAIAACTLLMACHVLLNREGFVLLCKALDSGLPPDAIRRIWGRSLLTKYVPGGVWQLVGRGLQMRKLGSLNNSAVLSGIIEQCLSLALCLTIALCAYLALSGHPVLAVTLAILFAATLWLAPRLLPWARHSAALRRATFLYAAAMPFYLAAYACVVTQLPLLDLSAYLFTGTLAGMAAFMVPGGIGVRESIVSLLAADKNALLLAAMMLVRLLTLGVEILITLVSMASRP